MFTYLRACTCLACAHTCMPPSPKQAGKLAYVLQGQNACQARAARLPGKDKCMHALSLYTLCLDAAHTPPSDFTYPAYCRPWHTCTLLPSVPTCTPVHPRVPMCTPVHPRVPMCTPVHPRVPMCTQCTHVYPCVPQCTHVCPCVPQCTHVYPCVPQCTHVYPHVPQCTHVCPCVPQCTHVYPCVPQCTHVYPCVPQCTHVCPCVPMCTPVHPRVPMCTPVHPRVPMCTPVHPRVPMCTFSSVYAHPHRAPTIQVHANTGLVCCHTKLGDLEMLTLIIAKHTTLSAFPCTHLAPPSPSTQHAHTTLCLSLSLACASLCSQCVFKGLPLATACAPLLAQPASPSTLSLWLTLVSTCTSFDPQPMNIPASTFARPSTLSL